MRDTLTNKSLREPGRLKKNIIRPKALKFDTEM